MVVALVLLLLTHLLQLLLLSLFPLPLVPLLPPRHTATTVHRHPATQHRILVLELQLQMTRRRFALKHLWLPSTHTSQVGMRPCRCTGSWFRLIHSVHVRHKQWHVTAVLHQTEIGRTGGRLQGVTAAVVVALARECGITIGIIITTTLPGQDHLLRGLIYKHHITVLVRVQTHVLGGS